MATSTTQRPGDPRLDDDLRDRVSLRLLDDPEVIEEPTDRAVARRAVARALAAEGVVATPTRWATIVRDLVDELVGLGPLEPLLRDPAVTDVVVNAPDEVWVDRGGALERVAVAFRSSDHVLATLRRVLGPRGVRLDRGHPWADAVLEGGIRLHALLPPLSDNPVVTLRRVPVITPSWDELEAAGSVTAEARALLREAVHTRANVAVVGPAGAGKTTLLSRLLSEVGGQRLVVIEDTPELRPEGSHAVHLHVRPPSPDGVGGVDVATLVRQALRMRPDRLVIGEVRGAEVADLLQAMNTGHAGSMTTVHANGARDALVRLGGMALLAGLPTRAVEAQLATALDVVVALSRHPDGSRCVDEIAEVEGERRPAVRIRWRR